jgi:hypothetical protein
MRNLVTLVLALALLGAATAATVAAADTMSCLVVPSEYGDPTCPVGDCVSGVSKPIDLVRLRIFSCG